MLHDNARPHVAEPIKYIYKIWIQKSYIELFDYYLFRAIQNDLSSQHFKSFEDIEKWIDEWIASKSKDFY